MTFDFQKGELLLIDKPLEWTSFDVIKKIRNTISRHTGTKKVKVGHAGTLDPLASGLLIVCTGKLTKQIEEYQSKEKEYIGSFFLGATTPSFDRETEVDQTFEIKNLTDNYLRETASHFKGEQWQVPPVFSAINIQGTRAYHIARNNEDVKLSARKIVIHDIELTNIQLPFVHFRVVCSKGTYIRSLARDFGKAAGCGAYLNELCRTRIGKFLLKDSISLPEFEKKIALTYLDDLESKKNTI